MVMDASTLQQLWRHRDLALVRRIVPWGIAGTVLGWGLFGVLSASAVAGVWLGVWMTRHVSTAWFYRLAYAGMLLTGLKLLWDGWR